MNDATLAMSVARGRIVVGLAALVCPRLAVRVLGGRRDPRGIAPPLARMLGGRDVALGLGTVIALDRGKPVRGWLEGAALADAVDCAACLLAREEMPAGVCAIAAGLGGTAAAVGLLLSRRLDPAPPAHPGQPEAVATGHAEPPGAQ
jgi:hypothetical protein